MGQNPMEWELQQLTSGTEIMVSDAQKKPIARGVLRADRKGLSGPNGEYFSLENMDPTWSFVVVRQRRSDPGGKKPF